MFCITINAFTFTTDVAIDQQSLTNMNDVGVPGIMSLDTNSATHSVHFHGDPPFTINKKGMLFGLNIKSFEYLLLQLYYVLNQHFCLLFSPLIEVKFDVIDDKINKEFFTRYSPQYEGVTFRFKYSTYMKYLDTQQNNKEYNLDLSSLKGTTEELEDLYKKIFPIGSFWYSRDALFSKLNNIGQIYGFSIRKEKHALVCSLAGKIKVSRQKNSGKTQCCDCPFRINLLSLYDFNCEVEGDIHKACTNLINNQCPVVISKFNSVHNHDCTPQLRAKCDRSSGHLAKQLPEEVMFLLANIMKTVPQLTANHMRPHLEDCVPQNTIWTASQLSNIRKKLKSFVNGMTADQLRSKEKFQTQFRNDEFWKGFFSNPNSCFQCADQSSYKCKEIYEELYGGCIFQSNKEDSDSSNSTLIKVNQVYKTTDDGYDFSIMLDGDKCIVGILWQTGAMRDAFDRYGSYMSLDAMLRKMNTSGLPYISICVFDESGAMLVAIEGIAFIECIEAYKFMVSELLDMAGTRRKEDILVVAGDLFFNQSMVTNDFDLPNATYLPDQWHLKKAVKEYLGPYHYTKIEIYFQGMIRSNNEYEFNSNAGCLMNELNVNGADADIIGYVHSNLINKESRWLFAQYEVDETPGTFGRHGSTVSEQNHSSILQRLGKNYCDHPTKQQRDLMYRTLLHQTNLNERLMKGTYELKRLNTDATNELLRMASACIDDNSLNIEGYKLFLPESHKATYYEIFEKDAEIGHCIVQSKDPFYNDVVTFTTHDSQCSKCKKRVAYQIPCKHEICRDKFKFIISRFDRRYHYRSKPTPLVPRNAHRDHYYPPGKDIIEEAYRIREQMKIHDNRRKISISTHTVTRTQLQVGNTHNSDRSEPSEAKSTTIFDNCSDIPDSLHDKIGFNELKERATECISSVVSLNNNSISNSLLVVFHKITKLVKNGVKVTASSFVKDAKNILQVYEQNTNNDDPNNNRALSTVADPLKLSSSFSKKQSSSRLRSSHEKSVLSKRNHKKRMKTNTCSVCNSCNHNIGTCDYLKIHGNLVKDVDEFQKKVTSEYHCQLSTANVLSKREEPNRIPGILKSKFVKNFVVHYITSQVHKFERESNINDLNMVISGITDDCKMVHELYKNVVVSAVEFINYTRSTLPTGKKGRRTKFIFDNIALEGQGDGFVSRMSSHSCFKTNWTTEQLLPNLFLNTNQQLSYQHDARNQHMNIQDSNADREVSNVQCYYPLQPQQTYLYPHSRTASNQMATNKHHPLSYTNTFKSNDNNNNHDMELK